MSGSSGNFLWGSVGLADREANEVADLEVFCVCKLAEVLKYWSCKSHVHFAIKRRFVHWSILCHNGNQ